MPRECRKNTNIPYERTNAECSDSVTMCVSFVCYTATPKRQHWRILCAYWGASINPIFTDNPLCCCPLHTSTQDLCNTVRTYANAFNQTQRYDNLVEAKLIERCNGGIFIITSRAKKHKHRPRTLRCSLLASLVWSRNHTIAATDDRALRTLNTDDCTAPAFVALHCTDTSGDNIFGDFNNDRCNQIPSGRSKRRCVCQTENLGCCLGRRKGDGSDTM